MKWYNYFRNELSWINFTQSLYVRYELKFFPSKTDIYCEKRFNFIIYSKPKSSQVKMKGFGGYVPVEVVARVEFNYDNMVIMHYNIYRYKNYNGFYIYNFFLDGKKYI